MRFCFLRSSFEWTQMNEWMWDQTALLFNAYHLLLSFYIFPLFQVIEALNHNWLRSTEFPISVASAKTVAFRKGLPLTPQDELTPKPLPFKHMVQDPAFPINRARINNSTVTTPTSSATDIVADTGNSRAVHAFNKSLHEMQQGQKKGARQTPSFAKGTSKRFVAPANNNDRLYNLPVGFDYCAHPPQHFHAFNWTTIFFQPAIGVCVCWHTLWELTIFDHKLGSVFNFNVFVC